jgi:hypothetical protein
MRVLVLLSLRSVSDLRGSRDAVGSARRSARCVACARRVRHAGVCPCSAQCCRAASGGKRTREREHTLTLTLTLTRQTW